MPDLPKLRSTILFLLMTTACFCQENQARTGQDKKRENRSDTFINNLLRSYPQLFENVLSRSDELKVQVIFSQVDRSKKGKTRFTDHSFRLDPDDYFYPASTVKLPVAILALQKLHELKIDGLTRNSTMITEAEGSAQTPVYNDPSAPDGRPTIAHYIKKILLVSDNDAFNRLYEFLGQEYINNSLHKMGYTSTQIIHRLDISLPEEENRRTNPVIFLDNKGGLLYKKQAEKSTLVYAARDTKMGKGFMRGDVQVNEPFDFSAKNRLLLQDLHHIVKSVLFPEAVPAEQRFKLTNDDYDFLRKYMSMMPYESKSPVYDTTEYWDTYVKFLYYGAEKNTASHDLRIFNKIGDAYGFMIDAAYIRDEKNKIEFMVSAVIHCNSDGIFNDDKYEYGTVGLPFFKHLGRVLYEYELKRPKKFSPAFPPFHFSYSD